jgi:hypothetical protein
MSRRFEPLYYPLPSPCRLMRMSARCSASNSPDQPCASCLFTPLYRTLSTSNAISRLAARSESSETERSGRGKLQQQHEPQLGLPDFASLIQVRVTVPMDSLAAMSA